MGWLDVLGAIINSPITSGITSLISSGEQNRVQQQYERDTDQQINDAMRVAMRSGPASMQAYDYDAQQGLKELFGLRDRQTGQAAGVVGGFEDRYKRAEADLQGYGQQQKADIDKAFAKQQGAWNLNPLSRGSTVGGTVSRNIDLDRLAEQRRLGDDLTRQRLDFLTKLSGDTLGARQWSMGQDSANTGNLANWFGTSAVNRSNLARQGYGDVLNVLMNTNRVPPPSNAQQQFMSGQNAVQPTQPQGNWFTNLMGGALPGVGEGIGAGLTNAWPYTFAF